MMTQYREIDTIRVDFTNRDGVPTSIVVTPDPGEAICNLVVSDDGMSASFEVNAELNNSPSDYRIVSNEKDDAPVAPVATVASKPELGNVGKVVVSVVALAILTPFIGLLWDWAIGVIQR